MAECFTPGCKKSSAGQEYCADHAPAQMTPMASDEQLAAASQLLDVHLGKALGEALSEANAASAAYTAAIKVGIKTPTEAFNELGANFANNMPIFEMNGDGKLGRFIGVDPAEPRNYRLDPRDSPVALPELFTREQVDNFQRNSDDRHRQDIVQLQAQHRLELKAQAQRLQAQAYVETQDDLIQALRGGRMECYHVDVQGKVAYLHMADQPDPAQLRVLAEQMKEQGAMTVIVTTNDGDGFTAVDPWLLQGELDRIAATPHVFHAMEDEPGIVPVCWCNAYELDSKHTVDLTS